MVTLTEFKDEITQMLLEQASDVQNADMLTPDIASDICETCECIVERINITQLIDWEA